MFIQTETTPNPATLKFLPGQDVLGARGTAFYTDAASAKQSPLASALFEINDITAIFLGRDFITVTKKEEGDWDVLRPILLTAIMDHYTAGKPVMEEVAKQAPSADVGSATDDPIISQIVELIDTRVRPAVAMDGGDIVFHSFEEGVVKLEMHGACSGCPSSTATLKQGIENMLCHYIPEVKMVEAV
ncbi:MAG: NifU family protein [Alphaproteobacteria bacterium]|nr:NifU family protein [Alphaproteobacteria bacterium]